MLPHVMPETEALAAVGALVVLLPRVDDPMAPQFLRLFEPLSALIALERPLVRVVHHVQLELLPGRRLQPANRAFHVFELFLVPELFETRN